MSSVIVSERAQALFNKIQAMQEQKSVAISQVSAVTDVQLEAWKKMPKEQAVKELLHFLEIKKPAIQDDRDTYLSGLKLLAEITGAITPVQNAGAQIVAIRINMPDPISKKIIEIDNGK